MLLFVIFTLFIITQAKKDLYLPMVKTTTGIYYLELFINNNDSKSLFEIDFNSSQSYIDGSVLPEVEPTHSKTMQVKGGKGQKLGELQFQVLPANISWIQHKGKIGLGQNSTFIQMLQKSHNKSIALRFQLQKLMITIQQNSCQNSQSSPFAVSVSTWTTIDYTTPLSFNFRPSQDFLALLNSTQNNFKISSKQYNSKTLHIQHLSQHKNIKLSKILKCWNLQSTNTHECEVKIQNQVDVGVLLFTFPIRVCKNGIEIGGKSQKSQYYFNFFMILVVFVMIFFLLAYFVKIKYSFSQNNTKYSYNPPSWIEQQVEDILANDDI